MVNKIEADDREEKLLAKKISLETRLREAQATLDAKNKEESLKKIQDFESIALKSFKEYRKAMIGYYEKKVIVNRDSRNDMESVFKRNQLATLEIYDKNRLLNDLSEKIAIVENKINKINNEKFGIQYKIPDIDNKIAVLSKTIENLNIQIQQKTYKLHLNEDLIATTSQRILSSTKLLEKKEIELKVLKQNIKDSNYRLLIKSDKKQTLNQRILEIKNLRQKNLREELKSIKLQNYEIEKNIKFLESKRSPPRNTSPIRAPKKIEIVAENDFYNSRSPIIDLKTLQDKIAKEQTLIDDCQKEFIKKTQKLSIQDSPLSLKSQYCFVVSFLLGILFAKIFYTKFLNNII